MKEKKKQQYRIRNWPEYNAALKARGSLTLWVDEDALAGWREAQKSGRRGASRLYSESAILCALSVQMVYRLPLRATVGLLSSLFELMGVELPVPDYSTLSRRRVTLEVQLGASWPAGPVQLGASWPAGPVHLVVDGSGFKVFGEGRAPSGWESASAWYQQAAHLA